MSVIFFQQKVERPLRFFFPVATQAGFLFSLALCFQTCAGVSVFPFFPIGEIGAEVINGSGASR